MYLNEIKGKGGIVARLVAKSWHPLTGSVIATMELEYPRFIHGEIMTHRVFSRNAMSSRAVPIEKMMEQVEQRPAKPVHWGRNQAGMQAKVALSPSEQLSVEDVWEDAAADSATHAYRMSNLGLHKQVANRVLEPFQMMKTVVTSTEWANFFELRFHEDAQPEMFELARTMEKCLTGAQGTVLHKGDWHLPYVDNETLLTLGIEDAKKVSASCCAQVSYRNIDVSVEKALKIYDKLVAGKPVHASPFEHQATPAYGTDCKGVTHISVKDGAVWSGNFRWFIQHRQVMEG